MRPLTRRSALAALAGTSVLPLVSGGSASAASTVCPRGIPRGYEAVDPRTATRVALWHELSQTNPLFPEDPPFTYSIETTVADGGYLLEKVTSMGTHTGTHISAPAHFHEGAAFLDQLSENWTLMPLVVVDVRPRLRSSNGDFSLAPDDLRQWERLHGVIPAGACVLMLTGYSALYTPGEVPGPKNDYFDFAPGFTAGAVAWLFDARGILAVGSDTFGPDATSDEEFSATSTALGKGGITVENVGRRLARMRSYGDWVSINGPRPHFSGFQMGVTGFTLP